MALMPSSLEVILGFEPIVKLVCANTRCKHNLTNAANNSEEKELACNLKHITINENGCCANFESTKPKMTMRFFDDSKEVELKR